MAMYIARKPLRGADGKTVEVGGEIEISDKAKADKLVAKGAIKIKTEEAK